MTIKASNGTSCYIAEVIAFILCYLKKELQKHLALPGNDAILTTNDFDWVITVPAIWKSRGKLMMREAAYMVCIVIIMIIYSIIFHSYIIIYNIIIIDNNKLIWFYIGRIVLR